MTQPRSGPGSGAVIERAVAFIRERVRMRSFEFAMEVGEYLFREIYKGDIELYRRASRWSDLTLTRIASDSRVNLSLRILSNCVRCFLAVRQFARAAPDVPIPELAPWEWGALFYPLRADPDLLVSIVLWVAREDVSVQYLEGLAQTVRPYLAQGGNLDDLLVDADTDVERMARLLGIVESRLSRQGLPASVRARTVEIVDAILERLQRTGNARGPEPRLHARPGSRKGTH